MIIHICMSLNNNLQKKNINFIGEHNFNKFGVSTTYLHIYNTFRMTYDLEAVQQGPIKKVLIVCCNILLLHLIAVLGATPEAGSSSSDLSGPP